MLDWKKETCSTCIYYDDSLFKCKGNHRTWTNSYDPACEYWYVPYIVIDKESDEAKRIMPWESE